MIDGMDPWELDQILATIGSDEEKAALLQQMESAQALRNRQSAPTINAGRVVVPNIGGAVADAVGGIKGKRDFERAEGDLGMLRQRDRDATKTWFNAAMQTPAQRRAKAGVVDIGDPDLEGATQLPGIDFDDPRYW
jgi:hypothetical protein